MTIQWSLPVYYKAKPKHIKAVLEYHSRQIMKIRVYGKKGSFVLQCDYPMIRFANSKRGVKWKIIEGSLGDTTEDGARLLVNIMGALEDAMKRDFDKIYPPENLLFGE